MKDETPIRSVGQVYWLGTADGRPQLREPRGRAARRDAARPLVPCWRYSAGLVVDLPN